MSRSTVIEQLLVKLRADTVGGQSLVTLTGDAVGARRIVWTPKRAPSKYPTLGVAIKVAVPLFKEVTSFQTYLVMLTAYGKREEDAIRIADRTEELFHDLAGTNRSYYNFSNASIAVQSTRWVRRSQIKFDEDLDHWEDVNFVEIVANASLGCS